MQSPLNLGDGDVLYLFSRSGICEFHRLCAFMLISYYKRNGARCSIGVGFPLRVLEPPVPDTAVSEAPDGFLDNFVDGGNGVLDPLDGVRTLKQIIVLHVNECTCSRVVIFQHCFETVQMRNDTGVFLQANSQ